MEFHENHKNSLKLPKPTITYGISRKSPKLTKTHENHHNTWIFTKITKTHPNSPKLTKTTITHGISRKSPKLTQNSRKPPKHMEFHENHPNTRKPTKNTWELTNPRKRTEFHENRPNTRKSTKNTWEFTNPRCRRRPTALLHPALRLPLRPRASSDDWRCNPPRRQYLAANAPTCLPTYLPPADALLPCS